MSENSKIEWTDHTFNPWEGCQKVGAGCDHCYAEARNARFGAGIAVNWGPGAPRRRTSAANWRKPLQWNANHAAFFTEHGRRQRVFCASLADVFDNAVDSAWRRDLCDLIELTPNLNWLLLTKRIGNAFEMIARVRSHDWMAGRDNVWLGATVVNQEEANRDIPKLLATPARIHFVSIEPMLGRVDLVEAIKPVCKQCQGHGVVRASDDGGYWVDCACERASGLHWVICGGESGRGARPVHPDWIHALRDQCKSGGVNFLFKQWGEWLPGNCATNDHYDLNPRGGWVSLDGATHDGNTLEAFRKGDCNVLKVGKKNAGRLLDGRTHDEFPRGAV